MGDTLSAMLIGALPFVPFFLVLIFGGFGIGTGERPTRLRKVAAKRSIHTNPDLCQVGGRRQHDSLQVAPTVRLSIVHQQHNRQPAPAGQVLKPVGVQKVQVVIEH